MIGDSELRRMISLVVRLTRVGET